LNKSIFVNKFKSLTLTLTLKYTNFQFSMAMTAILRKRNPIQTQVIILNVSKCWNMLLLNQAYITVAAG